MSQQKRKLLVVPCCGLCNRIQVLICGQLLAEDTGREFFLGWAPAQNCGAAFEDLFTVTFPTLPQLPAKAACFSSIQRHIASAPDRYAHLLRARPQQRFGRLRSERRDVVAVFTCHQFLDYFHDPRFASRLRELFLHVQPDLAAEAESFAHRWFTPHTVGVHVRRGDWRSQRELDYYLKQMRRIPGATFLVCSDDAGTVEQLRDNCPGVISYPKSALNRDSRDAIRQALVDVLLLARTSYLIGTPGSSFSAIPQALGDIPGNWDYGLSISLRDLKLGNLSKLASKLRRRRARSRG